MNLLENLTRQFNLQDLQAFFRQKLPSFRPETESYDYLFDDRIFEKYQNIQKLGEAVADMDDLLVITAQTTEVLTERSSKKRQYEIAKKILKEAIKDAAFFIFYDTEGNFRFSFVRVNYSGAKRSYTDFKRYSYYVSPKQTNKTFIQQLSQCRCQSLDDIIEAFSVEPLNKDFYKKLQYWYFWAVENVRFPKDAEALENGRQLAVIRLITRMTFIWFMRVRQLVPDQLFDEAFIAGILKDMTPESASYYKAILQNLFFTTLNTPMNERRFFDRNKTGHKGYNPDSGNHNVFRYAELFKDEQAILNIFAKIPFLNGGLFECLDYKKGNAGERKYIDGFTGITKHQAYVPNELFFAGERQVDIQKYFGNTSATYKTEGLLNILKSYNFTIDENDPDDIEVALDPELLGSIFENLLASYNPETATTARNATGSFYTPREIVNYMTTESLKNYFLNEAGKQNLVLNNTKLNSLLNDKTNDNPFDQNTTLFLVEAINNLRAVDPAVGSGAFPMALLNKLVFILEKIDPENRLWQQAQISSVKQAVTDRTLFRMLEAAIKDKFKQKNADYGRKVYLIEKCIYGVDLQQIAVEIAKLRFFISLLVDENIDWDKPEANYNIDPLPNLDFKLMQGNSLVAKLAGIDFDRLNDLKTGNENTLFDLEKTPLQEQIETLETLKSEYIYAQPQDKKRLRQQIEQSIVNIIMLKIADVNTAIETQTANMSLQLTDAQKAGLIARQKKKLSRKTGIDVDALQQEITESLEGRKPKKYFLWRIFFAEVFNQKKGFDIVIGNPPYIQLQKALDGNKKYADVYKDLGYESFERTGDIYSLFYEKGLDILHPGGLLCYITSNKWMRAAYGKSLRGLFSRYKPLLLLDLGPGVFDNATVDTNILLIQKTKTADHDQTPIKALTLNRQTDLNQLTDDDFAQMTPESTQSWIILSPQEQALKNKIETAGTPLKDWDIDINYGIKTGYNQAFVIESAIKNRLIAEDPKSADIIKPLLRGRDIKRYKAEFAGLWLITTHNGYKKADGTYVPPVGINNYPAVKKHLEQYSKQLKKRQDKGLTPYNLRNCAYMEEFEKEKILYSEIAQEPSFYLDKNQTFINNTAYLLTGKHLKYLLALLNSKFVTYIFANFYSINLGNSGYRYLAQYMEILPIPKIPEPDQAPFVNLVNRIVARKAQGADTTALEQQIDRLVYKLYGLTYDEVLLVEPDFSLSREAYQNVSLKSFVNE